MSTMTGPVIVERSLQHYVGIRQAISWQQFDDVAARVPEVIAWLASQGIAETGPTFFRYWSIDPDLGGGLVEAGVPVALPIDGEGDIVADSLPAGRYAVVECVGDPDGLFEVADDLVRWAPTVGERWDAQATENGELWGCRLEVYLDSPETDPALAGWRTQLAFRLIDRPR